MTLEKTVQNLFAGVCAYEAVAISTGAFPPLTRFCRERHQVTAALIAVFLVHVYWKIEKIEQLVEETVAEAGG